MSQRNLIILGAVILIGAGLWYYQTTSTNDRAASTFTGDEREQRDEETRSFTDILKSGDSMECRFKGIDPETNQLAEGTIYIDGESFKIDADTVIDGKPAVIHVIQHDMVMYMWSDDAQMPGIKIDTRAFADAEVTEKPRTPIDILKDPEADIDHECNRWAPRDDSFTPPMGMEFTDMFTGIGTMMQRGR